MKSVLLDESVPVRLRRVLASPDLDVLHADRALLEIVSAGGFDVFLTCDQSLPKQQNLASRPFGTVVVCTNNWPTILANLTEIIRAVESASVGRTVEILKGAHRTRYGRTPRASP